VGVGLLGRRLVAVVETVALAVGVGVDLVLVAEGLLALEAEDAWACTARRETPAIAARAMEL
jgi:hypothetical protein